MRSWQRVLGPQVDSEEQEQKLLMRRREVITERRCQLRGIGGDLFVISHRLMANHAKLAGNVTSSIALLTWRSWEMGLIFNTSSISHGVDFQFRPVSMQKEFSWPSHALNDNVMLNKDI